MTLKPISSHTKQWQAECFIQAHRQAAATQHPHKWCPVHCHQQSSFRRPYSTIHTPPQLSHTSHPSTVITYFTPLHSCHTQHSLVITHLIHLLIYHALHTSPFITYFTPNLSHTSPPPYHILHPHPITYFTPTLSHTLPRHCIYPILI